MRNQLLLSPHSSVPMYAQIVEQVVAKVMSGAWQAGAPLPSIRELASDCQVSVITVKRAYLELERSGVIVTRHGKGSFVAQVDQLAEQQKKQAVDAFRAAAQKLRQLGLTQAQLAQLLTEEEPTP